jgi:autotransporter-associated beta strand protein
LRLRKEGQGKWILTGTNSVSYPITVSNGTLLANSPGILNGAVKVYNGIFGGNGTVNSNVTIYAGGAHRPGNSPGRESINGDYSLNTNGQLMIEINGNTAGTDYDQLRIQGADNVITLGGLLQVTAVSGLSSNSVFTVIDNQTTNAISGTFSGLANNATFDASGYTWRVNYDGGDGNDVILTILSESGLMRPALATVNSRPPLAISVSSDRIELSWPDSTSQFTLFSATNLGASAIWTPMTNPVSDLDSNFRVVITNDFGPRYFRLGPP